jgi:hypothetical protein
MLVGAVLLVQRSLRKGFLCSFDRKSGNSLIGILSFDTCVYYFFLDLYGCACGVERFVSIKRVCYVIFDTVWYCCT